MCVSKGLELSCSYTTRSQDPNHVAVSVSVSERLQQLETLVLSFMQHQPQPQPNYPPQEVPDAWPTPSVSSVPSILSHTHSAASNSRYNVAKHPESAEHGKMREHSHGANYVSSVHWAAVLDSISELIDQCQEKEKEKKPVPEDGSIAPQIPGPRLLYEPVKETKAEILASMPARTVVDRMVARYFNALGIAPGTTLPRIYVIGARWG